MEILKRHKGLGIVGGLALILLILLIIICSKMFLSKNGGVYGNRLNNIEKISDGEIKKVTNAIEEKEEVSSVNIRIQGKIIIINIKYKNSTNKNKALEIANGTLELFDKEVLEDYDLEYLLIQEEDDKEDTLEYKIAGTKHHLHDYISYSKN